MKNFILAVLIAVLTAFGGFAQDKKTGGAEGKIRLNTGDTVAGAKISVQQDGKETARATSDKKGEFTLVGLQPGVYRFVFTKSGLSQGELTNVEIKTGMMLRLKKLVMNVDQGSLAIVRGSVFDPNGKSVGGAKIEVAQIGNNSKKFRETYSSQSGEFTFKLPPDAANYRFRITIDGAETASKELQIDGAQIYRFAVTLKARE